MLLTSKYMIFIPVRREILVAPGFRQASGIYVGAKTRSYLNITITFPTIWTFAGDFFQGFTEI